MSIPTSHLVLPILSLGALTFFSPKVPETAAPNQCSVEPVATPKPPPPEPRPQIEVAFVLDTTGSMGGLIEGAKAKIWSIASRIVQGDPSPRLRVGLVGYRDRDDAYVTRVIPLRDDLDAVHADLLSFEAAGGGDTPEDVARALGDAVEKLQWSTGDDVLRIIYLVGDAPPHAYPGQKTAAQWAEVARKRGIVVNAVRCGRLAGTESSFQSLAQLGGGLYFAVAQDGGMASVRTPFDDEIRRLEAEAGSLAMVGGSAAAKRRSAAKRDRLALLPAEASADRSAYHAASGAGARRWVSEDAVDLAAEPEALAGLEEEKLPSELKPMSPDERKEEVAKRAKRREEIDARLAELAKKRRVFLRENAARGEGLDAHVREDIERRAEDIGVSYRAKGE